MRDRDPSNASNPASFPNGRCRTLKQQQSVSEYYNSCPLSKPPFLVISKSILVSEAGRVRAWLSPLSNPFRCPSVTAGRLPLTSPPKRWLALRFPLVAADLHHEPVSVSNTADSTMDRVARRVSSSVTFAIPPTESDKRRDSWPRPSTKGPEKQSHMAIVSSLSSLDRGVSPWLSIPRRPTNNTPNNSNIII